MGDKGQGVQGALGQGGKDTPQNLLGVSARGGSIAAKDLAVDHQGTNGLFGGPARGLHVRIDDVTTTNDLPDCLVGGFMAFGDPKNYLGGSAPADRDPEGLVQQALDITVTEAVLVFHQGDQRLQVRAQLRRGGPGGVGGLQRSCRFSSRSRWFSSIRFWYVGGAMIPTPVARLIATFANGNTK